MADREPLLNTREVAERLGVSTRQVWALIRSGDLPAVKLNARVYRVAEGDLRAYIESRRVTVTRHDRKDY